MWHGLWRRLVELVRPERLDREAVEELSHHVEMLTSRKMAAGIDAREARRLALAEAGSPAAARQRLAEERTRFPIDQLTREIAYAARVLRRSPGLTLVSVVTMGAGIGVSALLFMLINGIVLQPLPYPEPNRLVRIFDTNLQAGIDRTGVASGNVADWRRRTESIFDGIAGYYVMGRTLSAGTAADVLLTAQVSEDFFSLIGVAPLAGRAFTAEEFRRATFNSAAAPTGPDPVVMLSHDTWQKRFAGDPAIVGRIVMLDRRPFRVVGVMPAGFALPDTAVQLWIPWSFGAAPPRDQHYLAAIARVKPAMPLERAETMLNAVAAELAAEHPATNRGWGVRLSPLATETVGDTARMLWVLLAAVGLFLFVVCANIALLSLIRGLDRREEVSVRLALGASSTRLLREFLLESALVAAISGAAGGALAAIGLRMLPALTAELPRLDDIAFDGRALAFIVGVTTLSAIVSGLPHAWRHARVAPFAGLSSSPLRATESRDRHRLRDAIVVAEIAMSVVLLTGASLLVRSVLQLQGVDPGFDPRGVIVAPVFLDNQQYNSGEKSRTYYRTLFERLSVLPGVVAVGGATTVPTSPLGPDFERPVWAEESAPADRTSVPAAVRMVTPGYLPAMGLSLVDGRAIDDRDGPQAPPVLMVSERLANRLWPGQRAVGKRLVVDYSTMGTAPYEIVGVIGDLRFRGPRSEPLAEIYLPHAQRSYLILNVVIKAAGDPRVLVPAIRDTLRSVDPLQPAHGLHALEDLVGATYARDRQIMVTLTIFAGAAIFLAVLSVYGVLSQRVRERAREIGIRIAVGASTSRITAWVALAGVRLLLPGLALGFVLTRSLGSVLDSLLFGVAATDVATTIVTIAAISCVGTLATLLPSWRAARIDPVRVLRRG
jgi:putative ABC transport system permease protein